MVLRRDHEVFLLLLQVSIHRGDESRRLEQQLVNPVSLIDPEKPVYASDVFWFNIAPGLYAFDFKIVRDTISGTT